MNAASNLLNFDFVICVENNYVFTAFYSVLAEKDRSLVTRS